MLNQLINIDNVYIYILSGCTRAHLDSWFKDCDVGLVAEHGKFYQFRFLLSASIKTRDVFWESWKRIGG